MVLEAEGLRSRARLIGFLVRAVLLLCPPMDFPQCGCRVGVGMGAGKRKRKRKLWCLSLTDKDTCPIGPRLHPHDLISL